MTHSPLTRSGVLTDILGKTASITAIARKHGVSVYLVRQVAREAAADLPDGRLLRGERYRIAITDGYAAGRPAADIAAELGCSELTVRVRASQMGVKNPRSRKRDYATRRGFSVPDHLADDYRFLTQNKRLTASEAGEALGLVPRKVA